MKENGPAPKRLRFNLGFLLESPLGTSRVYELNYPRIIISDDVTLKPLTGSFQMTRTSEGVYLSGDLHTTIITECVRCLEEALVDLTLALDDLFYYPPSAAPEGEYTVGENGFINLAPLVRELTLLATPSQPLCQPGCQGLCQECGKNLNHGECDCEPDTIDPRLQALKDLLD
mgnify:CR=1 FL=1